MNQILVTEKLYITPELKRKKKFYKINFFLSVFLVCVLVFLFVFSEYDRNSSEAASQEIMEDFNSETEDVTVAKNNVLIVVLDEDESDGRQTEEITSQSKVAESNKVVQTTSEGFKYSTIATINIPKINVQYPILDGETDSTEETKALLKISPTKFWGPEPNQVRKLLYSRA